MIIPKKIAIIGVGLIGGAIALGLKQHFGQKISILGSCNNPKRTKLALNRGIIDSVLDKCQIPPDVRLIILSAPVLSNIRMLKKISNQCGSGCLIIDVSSTKEVICKAADDILSNNVFFLGTHPMGGKETSGFENSSDDLFCDKPWIICPTDKSRPKDVNWIKELIKLLGAKAAVMTPALHDQITARISHMPSLMASGLVNNTFGNKGSKLNFLIASSGFRTTTRLASQDPRMVTDIIQTNKKNVLLGLKAFKSELGHLEYMIRKSNFVELFNYLERTKEIRNDWTTNSHV